MNRACSMHGKMENEFRILAKEPERKKLLVRPRYIWEDNIKLCSNEIGW
jgi:hypothetical protein